MFFGKVKYMKIKRQFCTSSSQLGIFCIARATDFDVQINLVKDWATVSIASNADYEA